MEEKEIQAKVVKSILKKRDTSKSFEDIVNGFEKKMYELNPVKNSFEIEKYFGEGKGKIIAKKLLKEDNKLKDDWFKIKDGKQEEDFKGLYVFIHNDKPFYVGISKRVINRIIQHVRGNSHNKATLAYKMGLIHFKERKGYEYNGKRKDFDFENEVEPIKEFLMKQKIAFIGIDNDDELALFEIYCSMKLGTYLNTFETH